MCAALTVATAVLVARAGCAGKTTRKSVTIHHLASVEGVGEVGPGWEYYLDLLVAARDGAADTAAPSFDDYYPAQRDYFTSLT